MFGATAKIGKWLKFVGAADYSDNIEGNISFAKHVLYEDFDSPAIDETNDWAVNESHGGSGAISVAKNGVYRLASSTTNLDKCELARELVWYASCAAIIEVRLKVNVITTVGINAGFVDAKSYSDDQIAFEISGATITDRATDGVCFVFDTGANNAYWHMCNTKNTTQAGTSIVIAPVAATYETFRIALDTAGSAAFYRNGVLKGFKYQAVTTTVALTPYVAVISRSASAARNLDVDYIKCWQSRGPNS